jgi:amino acid transporter
MAYMGAASRVGWMMGRCGLLPNVLGRINRQAVPSVALVISLALGIGMLLIGPGWQGVVSLLTATLVIALAMGPVSLAALRLQLPGRPRPYRLPCAGLWCPAAFVLATWAISWCGTTSLRGASLIVLLPAIAFVLLALRGQPHGDGQSGEPPHAPLNLRQGLWWFLYLGGLVAITAWPLELAAELILLAAWALLVFPLAVHSRLAVVSPWARIGTD